MDKKTGRPERPVAKPSANRLQRVAIGLAGADTHGVRNVIDEDLPVADLARVSRLLDRLDDPLDHGVGDGVLDLHFRQEAHRVLRTAVDFGLTLLASESLDLGDRQTLDAQSGQCFAPLIELERLDDRHHHFHESVPPLVSSRPVLPPYRPKTDRPLGPSSSCAGFPPMHDVSRSVPRTSTILQRPVPPLPKRAACSAIYDCRSSTPPSLDNALPLREVGPVTRPAAVLAESADMTSADLLIVGGGLVGLTLATAFGSAGLTVAGVDRERPAAAGADIFDRLASAIASGSAQALAGIGLWGDLKPHAEPIPEIPPPPPPPPLLPHYPHPQARP